MKKQAWMLVGLLTVAVALFGYQSGLVAAAQNAIMPPKVGVVDVTTILENSQKHSDWQQKMREREEKMKAEFQQLRKDLSDLEANIKTRNPGSQDYVTFMQEYAQKKALFESKNSLYEEQVTLEMQQWTESLYQDFLKVVDQVAAQKGLDLVLAKEKLNLPSQSLRDFMLTVKTSKILYCRPNLDITEEVLSALDNQ